MEQKLTAPPRVVFLSSGGVLGDIVLRRLLESGQFDIVGIVRSRRVLLRRGGFLRGAIACFARCGVIYTVYIWLITTFAEALGWLTKNASITRRAYDHRIPVLHTRNVNDEEGLAFLASVRPEVLVLAHFDQPLQTPLCDGQKYAAVNVHPSLLPTDQGLEPVLHALRTNRMRLGVTLHRTAVNVDAGKIVATKQLHRMHRTHSQSVLGLMRQLMSLGAELLVSNVSILPQANEGIPQTGPSSYNSWPNGRQVRQLYRAGHRLLDFRDAKLFFR